MSRFARSADVLAKRFYNFESKYCRNGALSRDAESNDWEGAIDDVRVTQNKEIYRKN